MNPLCMIWNTMGEPGCALEENIYVAGGGYSQTDGSYTPYMPHPAYNNPERINNEGGGITDICI